METLAVGIGGMTEFTMIGQLALAGLLGGLIGLERELHGQAAGLRTHMVLAIGSCLIMLVSIFLWESQNAGLDPGVPRSGDPGRIAAHVVAGIGFLGAGAIIRFGTTIKGLTTATCLWSAAGIGLAIGSGYWLAGLVATALILVTIFVFDKLEKTFIAGKEYRRVVVQAKDVPGLSGKVEEILRKAGVKVKSVQMERQIPEQRVRLVFLSALPDDVNVETLSGGVAAAGDVDRVEID